MDYTIKFVKQLSMYDADAIINHSNQGWEPEGFDNYYTYIVNVTKTVVIKFENDFKLMNYIYSLQELSKLDVIITAVESSEATYIWNKNERRWEKKIGETIQCYDFITNQWDNI